MCQYVRLSGGTPRATPAAQELGDWHHGCRVKDPSGGPNRLKYRVVTKTAKRQQRLAQASDGSVRQETVAGRERWPHPRAGRLWKREELAAGRGSHIREQVGFGSVRQQTVAGWERWPDPRAGQLWKREELAAVRGSHIREQVGFGSVRQETVAGWEGWPHPRAGRLW